MQISPRFPAFLVALFVGLAAPVLSASVARADFVTPGTGVVWSMDDLVNASGGAVTGGAGSYQFHQSVVVSVSDRLACAPGDHLTFVDATGTIGLEIRGAFTAIGSPSAKIVFDSSSPVPGAWRGLNFNDTGSGSEFRLAWCEIAYAFTAVDVVGAPIELESCDLHDNLDKVLDFSAAGGVIRHCRLHDNRRRTITMTLSSSPLIAHCTMENNNLENSSPYPYVNVGLQGTNSPTIRGCTILGSGHQMSGGISIWALSNALIEQNRIEGCGYGILCYSTGANPTIRGNVLVANNIHPDTLNWGFGIACNGNNAPIVAGNLIRGHGYGVAVINNGHPNLGDLTNGSTEDDGGNSILENGLSRIYGLYNNTPLAQKAQGNWWGGATVQEVEDAIFHQPDNPSLGLVDYAQWMMYDAVPTQDPSSPVAGWTAAAVPNPFGERLSLELPGGIRLDRPLGIFDATGRLVRRLESAGESGSILWDGRDEAGQALPAGVYFYRGAAGGTSIAGQVVRLARR